MDIYEKLYIYKYGKNTHILNEQNAMGRNVLFAMLINNQ